MDQYYYVDANNQQVGPFSLTDLVAQGITPQTLVWKAGMAGWLSAAQVPEVAAAMHRPEPPRPGIAPPADMLVWAILSTVLCCMPLGIAAIVYASNARSATAQGDMESAHSNANTARTLCIISAALGLIVWIVYILMISAGAMASI